jgi:O-acetyl-ADP-ribose deacetylase (regulator of RNase III)
MIGRKKATTSTVRIVQGNITRFKCDAIVNAANDRLAEGGGVCGAIFGAARKAGGHAQLTAACRAIGHCTTGDAVITPSFGLDAPWIIHAVGPQWEGKRHEMPKALTAGNIAQLRELASAYRAILRVCRENNLSSVAIPSISTGIYGLPQELGAAIAVQVCSTEADGIEVTLVAYDHKSLPVIQSAPSPAAAALLAGVQL